MNEQQRKGLAFQNMKRVRGLLYEIIDEIEPSRKPSCQVQGRSHRIYTGQTDHMLDAYARAPQALRSGQVFAVCSQYQMRLENLIRFAQAQHC